MKYQLLHRLLSSIIILVLSSILVIVVSGVITSGFVYQINVGQNPCPLCFLQRLAMIGIGVGQVLNFQFGISMSHHAISLFHALFGAAVSLRQICLHICPSFPTFGTPVFGLSLYTWAFIVFFCSLIVIGIMMLLYDPRWKTTVPMKSHFLNYLEKGASLYLCAIIILDIISAAIVCGSICPDNP